MQKIIDANDKTNVLFRWKWSELTTMQKAHLIAEAVTYGIDMLDSKEEAHAQLDEAARHIWPLSEGMEGNELFFVSAKEDRTDIDFLFNDGDFQPVRNYADRPARKKATRRFIRRLATIKKAA